MNDKATKPKIVGAIYVTDTGHAWSADENPELATMVDAQLYVPANNSYQENRYEEGAMNERKECIKFFDLNADLLFWGSQVASHIRNREKPSSKDQTDTVRFTGIDDTSQMGRVRRLLEAQGIQLSSSFIAQIVEASQEPVSSLGAGERCAQCQSSYKHGKNKAGCPKCAPGVSVSEAEFREPLKEQQPIGGEVVLHGKIVRVAEVVSSANPGKTVPWLAHGDAEIAYIESNRGFVRWIV